MKLNGKVVLLTGASDGIGRAAALALGRAGAQLLLMARSADKLEELTAEIRAKGGSAWTLPADITSQASVASALGKAEHRYEEIDVLINCAGNSGMLGYWLHDDEAKAQSLFDVHVFGMERMIRMVVPGMLRRGRGTIVNFSSTVGWVPMPTATAYSAAKAAVNAFSAGLRAELHGSGVRVLLFAPPHTQTKSGGGWPISPPVKSFLPERVADDLLRALRSDRECWVCGPNRTLLLLQRIWPWYAAFIMRFIGQKAAQRAGLASAGG